jgi:CheY-like chemotaxis protein
MRFLIIDDDEDLRHLLAHYLRQDWADADVEEFDPLTHPAPGDSFSLADYDLIILDYMLGRGDGLEWLKQFKMSRECPPVIFLTGSGNESIAVRAMKAGADDYLRKQELTRARLTTSVRELTQSSVERTLTPDLAERLAGKSLGTSLRIPGIRVLRLIGEGGMSRVYLASNEKDDVPLVVKVLKSTVAGDETMLARFMEECSLIERIDSPHVARIYGHGVFESYTYLVMEFFDGGDLNKRLDGKALEADEALRMFRELMFALGDVHERGVLHRDLKPQNIMFRADGTLAIVDFGVAKHVDSIDLTGHGEVVGTPRYMSPEQVQGRALDLRTDIYSAGVLLYQMLTGKHLFEGSTAVEVALHHINTPPPPLPEGFERYERLLDKLLEKDRDARFRNADEVIGFLARQSARLARS